MTTLLIDLGNTALKWCTLDEPQPRTVVHRERTDFKEALYAEWLALRPERVVGSAVAAPNLAFSMTKFFNDHGWVWEWLRPQAVFRNETLTLVNGYDNPLRLGADRWNAAIGAVSASPGRTLLVVHMGTATTVDAIVRESDGCYRFEGGRIAPGPTLMLKGLTDGIPTLSSEVGVWQPFPTATRDAIATGIIDAQVGLVLRAFDEAARKDPNPLLLLAGGAAGFVAPHLKGAIPELRVHHNLVLQGLAARAVASGTNTTT